eukprot:Tamp_08070.p1 GENE.Tamp_08070~~Tamp_08070.p1  ORF type:complete len:770 (+),score=52.68 Tamp_08070:44-2311(+)
MQPPPLSQSQQLSQYDHSDSSRYDSRARDASRERVPASSIPARASDRNSGEDRRVSDTPRRMGDTPRSLGAGGGGYRPDSSYSQPRDRASDSDDRRGRTGMPVPSLGLGASSKTSPRISKEEVYRRRRQVMFDSDEEDPASFRRPSQDTRERDRDWADRERERERERDAYRERDSRDRARERERDDERERSASRSSRRGAREESWKRGAREEEDLHHHARQPMEVHSARENDGLRSRTSPHMPVAPPDTSYATSSASSSKLRGRSASPAMKHWANEGRGGGRVLAQTRRGDGISDSESDLDDIAARHATNFLAQQNSPPPPPPAKNTAPSGSRALWPPRAKTHTPHREQRPRSKGTWEEREGAEAGDKDRQPAVVFPEVREIQNQVKDLTEQVGSLRNQLADQQRASSTRIQSLEKARDRAEDEIRSLRNLVDALQSQVDELSHAQLWVQEKQRRSEQSRGESARSSPNTSHMNSSHLNSSHVPLAHPTDLSHSNSVGGRGVAGKSVTVALPSPRAVISADVVLDDGTRHLPFQVEGERERDKHESQIFGPDRAERSYAASPQLKDRDRDRPPNLALLPPSDGPDRSRGAGVSWSNGLSRGARARQEPGRPESPALRSQTVPITSPLPPPAESATTIKTPTSKPPSGRQHKVVIIQRQPIPGSQVAPEDKVGIGISFGMTAKGDVFITGMAPNGPAKSSGHIRRGDQLIAVDGTEISTWDVKDIVDLIVGPQGSFVRLEIATLPEDQFSPSPPPK